MKILYFDSVRNSYAIFLLFVMIIKYKRYKYRGTYSKPEVSSLIYN